MSVSKPPSIAELKATLCKLLPASETVDHLVRYLSTWSGSDKLFMIIQYAIKLIVPFLNARARLQHRAGFRTSLTSSAAPSLAKFAGIIGDARMLWRIWGLLPIIQWLVALERSPPVTRSLLNIERLQGWSMLFYYPLEHIYYLTSHSLIPTSFKLPSLPFLSTSSKESRFTISPNTVALYSSRFWAVYVFLQLLHLQQDKLLLEQRQRQLKKSKATLTEQEQKEVDDRWDAYWSELVVNVGYAPLTLHWSLEKGLFKNELWVGVLGLLAGITSFRTGWKATALPSPPPQTTTESKETPTIEGYDASADI